MTTGGEGGMVTTNDRDVWSRMWSFKDHGKSWEAVYERDHPSGFRWLHESFGTNWNLTEMQSAIGRIQLRWMNEWTRIRARNAAILQEHLGTVSGEGGPLRLPEFRCATCLDCDGVTGCRHANYKFYAYVRPDRLADGWDLDRVVAEVAARGVPCYQGSCSEVYLEKSFEGTGIGPSERLPVARELGETSVMLLVHPTLSEAAVHLAGRTFAAIVDEASL